MNTELKELKLEWEKWVDPLGLKKDGEFISEDEYESDSYQTDDIADLIDLANQSKPVAVSVFGLIPINQSNNPSKAFNFWVGHTNFYITEEIYKIIRDSPGVEIFDVFSPYRFRISVGKAFNEKKVKDDIKKNIFAVLSNAKPISTPSSSINLINLENMGLEIDPELKKEVLNVIDEVKKNNEFWIVYVLPNSEIEVSLPKDQKTFLRRKQIINQSKALAGGIVMSSDQ